MARAGCAMTNVAIWHARVTVTGFGALGPCLGSAERRWPWESLPVPCAQQSSSGDGWAQTPAKPLVGMDGL